MIGAQEALERLVEGNRRFVEGRQTLHLGVGGERLVELAAAQNPFAIILGCSDSRVPAEIVFDQGLGELFVIRVAGNTVFPSQVGSVEFAATQFGTPLAVVLGHSNCGAVQATLDQMRRPPAGQSPNLATIMERIRPAVEHLVAGSGDGEERLMEEAVRANVEASVGQLLSGSKVIEGLVSGGKLAVVGAEYSLETGLVSFL